MVSQPYLNVEPGRSGIPVPVGQPEQTFCLNLEKDLPELERNLHSSWRNESKRFTRHGGRLTVCDSESAVEPLIRMCAALSERKEFPMYGTEKLIRAVWRHMRMQSSGCVYAKCFQAIMNDVVCGSILVLRAGPVALCQWGAFDYQNRSHSPTRALQWSAIETLKRGGVKTYDLGGADESARSGVFEFKRRMGAELLTLPRRELILVV
jgi:lipid II:glycine glycyltransferase (peptidoglycan interpeptide bridge formation enzyme)